MTTQAYPRDICQIHDIPADNVASPQSADFIALFKPLQKQVDADDVEMLDMPLPKAFQVQRSRYIDNGMQIPVPLVPDIGEPELAFMSVENKLIEGLAQQNKN